VDTPTAAQEARCPPAPVPFDARREFLFQVLATAALATGAWYIHWRWTESLNPDALWLAVPLVVAETLAFLGSVLFFLSIWRTTDPELPPPPHTRRDIGVPLHGADSALIVDVFFATYNEDPELVRLSLRDAKAMRYPHAIDVRIHALDDGRRPEMRRVAEQEGVAYITRDNNIGFKAGNLRNALDRTQGDLIVICDADTRPFPDFLEQTLGYFRDPDVAWVQTPQWFYDIDRGVVLPEWLAHKAGLGKAGRLMGRGVQALVGEIRVGADPFGNDPQMFYDVIQRRRNWCNAAFCCGAGSVHRREAVMEAALRAYAASVAEAAHPFSRSVRDPELRGHLHSAVAAEAARDIEFTPYKFHVSEDIYTSIVLHSDPGRRWRSIFHPRVLSRMLSPQDLLAFTIQRFKYAGGTLDIFWNDNPLRRRGLSAWQKLMYGTTIYSYFAPLWNVVFLLSPIVYCFTGLPPLRAYDTDFIAHLVPFLVLNRLALAIGTWGVNTLRGEQYYLALFWLNLRAMADVLRRRPIRFHVTPKTRQAGTFLSLVRPHLLLIALSVVGAAYGGLMVAVGLRGNVSGYLANLFWSGNNVAALLVIVLASLRRVQEQE
jgi:cellulose synthase/poly-beta-1,6-N-acetylglucosamine synthase-like glycosyltransferase